MLNLRQAANVPYGEAARSMKSIKFNSNRIIGNLGEHFHTIFEQDVDTNMDVAFSGHELQEIAGQKTDQDIIPDEVAV